MPGSAFYVNYSISGEQLIGFGISNMYLSDRFLSDSDVWVQSAMLELPQNSTYLSDLQGNTQYNLYIISTDNGLETNSSLKTFRTLNSTAINEVLKGDLDGYPLMSIDFSSISIWSF